MSKPGLAVLRGLWNGRPPNPHTRENHMTIPNKTSKKNQQQTIGNPTQKLVPKIETLLRNTENQVPTPNNGEAGKSRPN